ncbi:MAG TPA: Gfo/Idh/MocA family oxidoreductase, partial [Vicinamibacterales bacterium]|nr:Gfo/Idh/MocA family oxidoreductase [Vicinamibacterales bacterium]
RAEVPMFRRSRSRRQFLKTSVAGAAGAALASSPSPSAAAASARRVAGANRRVRVGLIGCGGMGTNDLRAMLRAGAQCVALCDVDDEQSARTKESIGKEFDQTPDLVTRDFRRLLDRKDIDAVVVATPDHWHALQTVMACQAGKDVYVEKPLALSIGEGRIMVDVARRHGRVVQMGTQQRSAPHFAEAVEYVRSGRLGKIRLVKTWAYQDWMGNIPVVPDSDPPPTVDYDMWLGPAPKRPFNRNRFHFNFRWFFDYSGGLMTDWGAHMIDIANWGMDVNAPRAAVSVGGKFGFPEDAEETPDTQQALWEFDGFSMVWEHATAIGQGPFMRDHGVAFHGNNGILVVDRGGWEVFPETVTERGTGKRYRMAGEPRRGTGGVNYHQAHVENFLECLDSRARPRSDVEIGHESMIACHLANIAFRLKRRVSWDVEGERVIGDEEAQAMVMAKYREPWSLTAVARS